MKGFSFAGTPAHPLRRALVLGVLTALLLQGTLLAHECSGIRQNVLRLHILAATNNCRDQPYRRGGRNPAAIRLHPAGRLPLTARLLYHPPLRRRHPAGR